MLESYLLQQPPSEISGKVGDSSGGQAMGGGFNLLSLPAVWKCSGNSGCIRSARFPDFIAGSLLFPLLHPNNCSHMIAQEFWLLFSKEEFLNPRLGRESMRK